MRPRGVWLGCALVACLLGAPVAAHAAVSFTSAPYPLPAGGTEYQSRIGAVALSDLNNDGRSDILVYRGGNGSVYVLLNQGGGTFADPQNRAAIRSDGVSVWLDAPLERVIARMPADGRRPLAADRADLERLYESRRLAYEQAHVRLDAGRAGVDALVEQLIDWLEA